MKFKNCLICAAVIIFASVPLFAEDAPPVSAASEKSESAFTLFANAGFGFAYNMYLEQAQNNWVDTLELLGYVENKNDSKSSLLYGSFGLNPRYETGNLVFSLPVNYYNVMKSKRTVINGATTATSEFELSIWAVSLIADYKIMQSDSSYLLIGGGVGYYKGYMDWNVITNGVTNKDSDSSWAIGWQTEIEYHWLFGNVDFYLGATSRFAEIISFKVHSNDGSNNMIAGLTGLNLVTGVGYRF